MTRYARGLEELRLSPLLPDAWRDVVRSCLTPTGADRPDASTLLRRAERAADCSAPPRSPRPRARRRPHSALLAAVAALTLATAATAWTTVRDADPPFTAPPLCEKHQGDEDTGPLAGDPATFEVPRSAP
ncbi:hypothetical protein [Streptomyces althioticus]|uniref:hypothetical protein n=1 Tax=Streptomyces althioticus TaxID=83380 RepID=UPI0033C6CCB2